MSAATLLSHQSQAVPAGTTVSVRGATSVTLAVLTWRVSAFRSRTARGHAPRLLWPRPVRAVATGRRMVMFLTKERGLDALALKTPRSTSNAAAITCLISCAALYNAATGATLPLGVVCQTVGETAAMRGLASGSEAGELRAVLGTQGLLVGVRFH